LNCDNQLFKFAPERPVGIEVKVFGQLLGNGAAAFHNSTSLDVMEKRPGHTYGINPMV
jgi:hypothetical protein